MSFWANMRALVNDTTTRLVRIDACTHAQTTIEYEHHEIHGGRHFFVGGYQDLAINNVLDFTWQMPDTTRWSHWNWKINTESETLWQIYEGAVVVNPLLNPIVPYNNDRNSANLSDTAMRFELQANLAAANADTNIAGAALLDSGISGAGRDAGNANRSNELIMAQNGLYCLRATATAAGYINFSMNWYEHQNRN